MRTLQQAVTWSPFPIAGGLTIAFVLLQPRPAPVAEPLVADLESVELPSMPEPLHVSAYDPAPPPPAKCALEGRPGSRARTRSAMAWFAGLSVRDQRITTSICFEDAMEPCLGVMLPPPLNAEELHERERERQVFLRPSRRAIRRYVAKLPEPERDCAVDYCAAMRPQHCDTPLVVAFDAQPIAFATDRASFAFQPEQPVVTDWPTAATPWLARDLDLDGAITSGAELFGDATRLPDGSTATNGFAALAPLDTNRDGVIDRLDPAFGSLLLWADRDGDRASDPTELRPAAEVVTSIPLANALAPRCDERGNCEGERGSLQWRDASGAQRTGAIVDVYLRRR